MSHFFETSNAGCALPDAFARSRRVTADPATPSWAERDSERGRVQRTIDYMVEHLTERMHVRRLASLINVSSSYYFALFKRVTGYAPIDFFIHLRMRRACVLLEETALSIKEIADELGYDDAFYFSRLFKSVTLIAPTEYRRRTRDSKESVAEDVLPDRFFNGNLPAIQNEKRKTGFQTP